MTFTQIDHVGIAVDDLETAVARHRRLLMAEPVHRETVADQGVEEVLFAIGSSYVQLLGALGADTPVGAFLAARGPGLHHVAYRVDDIDAAISRLKEQGVTLEMEKIETPVCWMAQFRDPDGNKLVVHKRKSA